MNAKHPYTGALIQLISKFELARINNKLQDDETGQILDSAKAIPSVDKYFLGNLDSFKNNYDSICQIAGELKLIGLDGVKEIDLDVEDFVPGTIRYAGIEEMGEFEEIRPFGLTLHNSSDD